MRVALALSTTPRGIAVGGGDTEPDVDIYENDGKFVIHAFLPNVDQNDIQVHAWVIATAIWRGNAAPVDPSHVFNLHGTAAAGAANWLTRRSDGLQQLNTDWILDPGHPDAAQWIVDVATSIVRSYNVSRSPIQ